MSAIQQDAADFEDTFADDESGANDFLKSFLPPDASKKKPSEEEPEAKDTEQPTEEKTEETDESDESPDKPDDEETSEDETKDGDEKADDKRKFADDEGTYVKVTVDGKEHEVPVKDLKRLWGQEAALTQKSQLVADERKKVETELTKNSAATQALLQRAQARFEPYSKVDFLLAAQQLSPEEYTALRNEATKAYEDVQFLTQHLDAYMTEINTTQQTSLRERATETLKELASDDADKGIPGWNEKVYDELRTYSTANLGVPAGIMNNLVDAWALRVLHKAMLYDKGSKKGNVVTTKVNKTPKKVVKTSTTPAASKSSAANGSEKAMAKLKNSGSTTDAEAAFLARWADLDD